MGCGCNKGFNDIQKVDPYVNNTVILRNGLKGKVFTRMVGERSRYGMKTEDGELVYFRMNEIAKLITIM